MLPYIPDYDKLYECSDVYSTRPFKAGIEADFEYSCALLRGDIKPSELEKTMKSSPIILEFPLQADAIHSTTTAAELYIRNIQEGFSLDLRAAILRMMFGMERICSWITLTNEGIP